VKKEEKQKILLNQLKELENQLFLKEIQERIYQRLRLTDAGRYSPVLAEIQREIKEVKTAIETIEDILKELK
jgi:hypothetical protein